MSLLSLWKCIVRGVQITGRKALPGIISSVFVVSLKWQSALVLEIERTVDELRLEVTSFSWPF